MYKLGWIFGLVLLFFVFLFINSKLTKKIESLKLIENKTTKDKIRYLLYQVLDKILSLILLLYFGVVILTIVGVMALLTIALFN
jgi:lipopolysaccharide/colanic/teichoic acid biosynthesis glycosyltransferase